MEGWKTTRMPFYFKVRCFFLSPQYHLETCPGSFTGSYPGEMGFALHYREFHKAQRGKQSTQKISLSQSTQSTQRWTMVFFPVSPETKKNLTL
jgi:hypothetical protein